MQCLNLSNKEVKAAVDELTTILGNEDAAYYIISENNGYAIDLAPNGALSKLFSDLLSHFNGNREQAIRAKAKTFTEGFKMRLGESLELSILDENGEYTIEQVIPTTSEPQNVNKKEESKPKLNKEYHPAEEFTSFYITNTGYGTATSGELIRRMSTYLPKHSLARKLVNLFKNTDISVEFQRLGLDDDAKYMSYFPDQHKIVVNVDKFNKYTMGCNAESIAHEIVHAFTARTLIRIKLGLATEQEKRLYDTLVGLHKKYQSKYDSHRNQKGLFRNEFYGLTDIDEFTAELLTNREFMNVLKYNIHESTNFWDGLKAFCKLLLERFGFTLSEVDSLYNDLFDLVTYNIENEVTELDFVDTNSDLITMLNEALNRIGRTLNSRDELTQDISVINSNILNALKARVKVYHNPDPIIEQLTRSAIEYQVKQITDGLKNELDAINNFLNASKEEIESVANMLIEAREKNNVIDDVRLNDLNEDFFSFYNDLVDNIVEKLNHRQDYKEVLGKNSEGKYVLDILLAKALHYKSLLDDSKLVVKSLIALSARDIIQNIGEEVGIAVVYNYLPTRDISAALVHFGAGDKIKDEAIKSIFYMVSEANDKVRYDTYAKASKLKALLDKINKHEQLQLFEVDDDGNTTGYFVRSRNFGKFEKAYKAEMDRICLSLGIDIEDLNLPENRNVRIEYNRQRNKWLSEHCERRFTAEYYEAFNHLSNEAQIERESIQVNIRNLTDKGRDIYGIFRPENLTEDERTQLKEYRILMKQLASIYDICGRKKTGIQLLIAEELTELNLKLSAGLKYKRNSKAYEEEKARIMGDKTLTDALKQEWLKLNSRQQFKEEFWNRLKQLSRKEYGNDYAELQDRRRILLNMFRDDNTGEIDAQLMPQSTKNAINAITKRMNDIRAKSNPTLVPGLFDFEDIAEIEYTLQWYKDKKQYYDDIIATDPDRAKIWMKENSYKIKFKMGNNQYAEKIIPRPWYTKITPKDKSMIEDVPNNNWLEISPDSPYYNKAYYQAQQDHPELKDEHLIPKKDKYNSEDRYNKIMNDPDKKALYDALLETMAEANEYYSNLNNMRPYRAPLISGSLSRYIEAKYKKSKGTGKVFAPFTGFWQYLVDKLSIRNDDKGNNKALTKPNSERLNLIPLNYIARLSNPEAMNADVVGSVIEYYKAAREWKAKKEILPKIEILKTYISNKKFLDKKGAIKNEESNVSKFIKRFVDMNLYDIRNEAITVGIGGNKSGKMLGVIPYKGSIFNLINYDVSHMNREINITKILSILRTLGTARNLALNFACALTGCFTAMSSHITNALVGRYYNPITAAYALRDIAVDLIANVPSKVGVTTRTSQLSKKMEYFEVGANPMLNQTNVPYLYTMVKKHWGFGLYSLSDHFVKGLILSCIMKDFKLIEINGLKKFMSREEYKQAMNLPLFTPKDFWDWNFDDKLSFDDATEIVAGELVAKDPANQEAVDKIKNVIGYTARSLAQSADGQLTDLQRSAIFANAMGLFMMMHRQYFPIIFQERVAMTRLFDYQMRRYREAVLRTPVRIVLEAIDQNVNVLTAFKNAYTNDPAARENIKKIIVETSLWAILNYLILPLLSSSADDDRRNWLLQLLVYSLEKTSFEMMAPYNPGDLINLIRNPSAIIDYFETMAEVATVPVDIMMDNIKELFTGEVNIEALKIIKKGAYRGLTRRQKEVINLTPFRNLMKLRDIQGARDYYNRNIRGVERRKNIVNPADLYDFGDIDFNQYNIDNNQTDFNFDEE